MALATEPHTVNSRCGWASTRGMVRCITVSSSITRMRDGGGAGGVAWAGRKTCSSGIVAMVLGLPGQ